MWPWSRKELTEADFERGWERACRSDAEKGRDLLVKIGLAGCALVIAWAITIAVALIVIACK